MDKNGNLPLYGEIIAGACVSDFDSLYHNVYLSCLNNLILGYAVCSLSPCISCWAIPAATLVI